MKMNLIFKELNRRIDFSFQQDNLKMDFDFGEVYEITHSGEIPKYKGDYEVIPKVESQTLETNGKIMVKDVLVHAVPVYEVSNTSGGTTVYIAKE